MTKRELEERVADLEEVLEEARDAIDAALEIGEEVVDEEGNEP